MYWQWAFNPFECFRNKNCNLTTGIHELMHTITHTKKHYTNTTHSDKAVFIHVGCKDRLQTCNLKVCRSYLTSFFNLIWKIPAVVVGIPSWLTGHWGRLAVLAQTQRTPVQRLSPKNKGVSPCIPLQAGYRSKKQSPTHLWLHVTSLAISFSQCYVTFFMF
jgi:hypothetical protein